MKRIGKWLSSFFLCVAMLLSPMSMPTALAADGDVCILTAYDRASLNAAFNTVNDKTSAYTNYLIQICPPSGVLDAEGDNFKITRDGINVSIEAARQDANDSDVSKTIKNATIEINTVHDGGTNILSTINIGCDTTNDCRLIMEGGGYLDANHPDIILAMLKTRGHVKMYLGPNAVFQNNISSERSYIKAGCLQIDGETSDWLKSKVYLEGATIQNCSTNSYDIAGNAVFVNFGTFIINSGTITECKGKNAAVFVHGNYGEFEMRGGSITNCTSTRSDGGAVRMNTSNGRCGILMTGGIITGNSAENITAGGGGIFIQSGYYEITENAQIYGNTAAYGGDDIYVVYTDSEINYIKDIATSFEGCWFYDNGGAHSPRWSADSPTDKYIYDKNTRLYYVGLKAVKTPTVTYEYNESVPTGASNTLPAATQKICGSTVDVENAPNVTGYTFSGWQTSDVTVDAGKFTMPDKKVNFVGSFSPTTYNITYNLDGGTVSAENPATYTIESADITLNNPEKTGYTFAGWTGTDITSAQQKVTIPSGSTGEREYTAKWTKNSDGPGGNDPEPTVYTISYDLNGGTLDGKTGIVTLDVEEGTVITLPEPTREGYVFDYWQGSKYNAGDKYTVTEAHTFTAQWKEVNKDKPADPTDPANTTKPADPKGPKTGDNSHLFLWIALLFISGGALVGTVVYGKKESK